MLLELHIWGPAFGLPSIDPACLATLAYFRQCVPSEAWALLPTSDPRISPFEELPALRAGDLWFAGFSKIIEYLRESSNGEWDLDKDLDPLQTASCVAFSTFLESRGRPLLDLSLYVSSENFTACTRPGLGQILRWPDSWFVPHRLRERAKKRSEHLGLSGLDVDTAQEDKDKDEGLAAQIPSSLRRPKKTVSAILGRDVRKNRFRLDAVTSDFLEPIAELLETKQWMLANHPTSLDCLAAGYLALLQGPENLPHNWIEDAMKTKHSQMYEWIRRVKLEWFHDSAFESGKHVAGPRSSAIALPWQAVPERSWQDIVNSLFSDCIEAVPVLNSALGQPEFKSSTIKIPHNHAHKQEALIKVQSKRRLLTRIIGSSFLTAVVAGILRWNGLLKFPRLFTRTTRPMRSFGEAGTLLGLG